MRKLTGWKKKSALLLVAAAVMMTAAGCGNGNSGTNQNQSTTAAQTEKKEPALSDIHQAVKDVYGENYIPSMQQDAQYISDVYGVTAEMYEEAIAEGPMISVHVDTFLAFKAAEGQADAIEEKLTAYREYLVTDSMQYPMNLPKVQASQVVREGDYVFFVMLGYVSDDTLDADASLEEFKKSNQLAVDAILERFK